MNRIKCNFGKNTEPLTQSVADYVNGFIHKTVLGASNKWHDSFSPYSISTMQGGVLDENNMVQYPNGGYIIISSDNVEFLGDLYAGLALLTEGYVQTMPFLGFESYSCHPNKSYDIVRIENLLLKDKSNKRLTFKDDNYLSLLREHCVSKLKRCGIEEKDAESIIFEPFHSESWKVRYPKIKEYSKTPIVNPSSNIMLVVKGNKIAREKLNCLGYGQSTGCGYGFAHLKTDKN